MADFILIDGDSAIFIPLFGAAVVAVQPGKLKGSGKGTYKGKKFCVAGDEGSVEVRGCTYLTPVYVIPGTGTITISRLGGNQEARHTTCEAKAVLLKGTTFTARFKVQSPAQQPPPGPGAPIPDATPEYSGTGQFITINVSLRGT